MILFLRPSDKGLGDLCISDDGEITVYNLSARQIRKLVNEGGVLLDIYFQEIEDARHSE